MPITSTTPFPGLGEDYSRVVPELRAACDHSLAGAARPFWIEGLSASDWSAVVTAEKAACDRAWMDYIAFVDKRTREAKTAKAFWHRRCERLMFYEAYRREASEQIAE